MFPTVRRICPLPDYEAARHAYDTIKPIRGDNTRPLGARRDKQYQIVRHESTLGNYAYSARLYETNVITYYPNGNIDIAVGKWNNATTIQFVGQVLGIAAYRTRGSCVFVLNGRNYAIKDGDRDSRLILQYKNGNYEVQSAPTHKQWAINRTAAKKIRASVSEFRNYLYGFVSLRAREAKRVLGGSYNVISFSVEELRDVLGVVTMRGEPCINTSHFYALDPHRATRSLTGKSEFHTAASYYYDLIRNDQPEDTKHVNFLKAAVGLFAGQRIYILLDGLVAERLEFSPDKYMETLDEVLFIWKAKDVLMLQTVKEGRVPSNKYVLWASHIGWENDQSLK